MLSRLKWNADFRFSHNSQHLKKPRQPLLSPPLASMQSPTAAATSGHRASRFLCTLPVPEVTPSSSIVISRWSAISYIPSSTSSSGLNGGPSLRAARSQKVPPATAQEAHSGIASPRSTRRVRVANNLITSASRDFHALPSNETLPDAAARTGQCSSGQLASQSDELEPESPLQPALSSQRVPSSDAGSSVKPAIAVACAALALPLVTAAAAHAASGLAKVPLTFLQGLRDFLGGNSGTLISPSDQWAVWTVLLGAAAGGFWYGRLGPSFELQSSERLGFEEWVQGTARLTCWDCSSFGIG